MDFAQGLQFGSAWLVNLALAGLFGVLSARHWLRDAAAGAPGAIVRARLDACWRPVALACLAGQFAALWSASATMAGLPPFDAFPALWTMLTATEFGKAGMLGLACAAALVLAGPLLLRGRSVRAAQTAVVLPFEARRAANGGPPSVRGDAAADVAVGGRVSVGAARWRRHGRRQHALAAAGRGPAGGVRCGTGGE
ncbi:hypothetical protein ACHMW6_17025 [Pseudoduganella sp. UC29_106]|uniref:hypothetical protein n=1 Tax=Pseudoduganella sp. UC29_106 TaxID=3374553 RepID=UPI003757F483